MALWVSVVGAPGAGAQTEWRASFRAAQAALGAGDLEAYHRHAVAAAESMPAGLLNRPFAQYHAARAAAIVGRGEEAVGWLRRAWDEDIEALMISFAEYDPAFEPLRADSAFRAVLGLAEGMELGVRPIRGGVSLITGGGSNLLLLSSAGEALLVDGGYAPAIHALRRALSAAGVDHLDHLVVTHPHEDHMGGAAELGREARVWAHPGTAQAMAEPYTFIDGVELPPKPASARPDVEVSTDTTFSVGSERVRVFEVAAHTGADLAVYVEGARVAHLGDAFIPAEPMMFPGGGDPDGFLDRFEAFLAEMAPETVVIAGHGEPATLDDVRHQIEETRACMALVRRALEEGLDAEQAAQRAEGRFPPQWVAYFHRALGGA